MQKQLIALIVYDERLSRKDLISLLSDHPDITFVGEVDNVSAVIQAIEQPNPDVMHKIKRFLDNINN